MASLRIVVCIVALLGAWVGLASCGNDLNFSDTPSISLERFEIVPGAQFALDTMQLRIRFKDGNGDLGLSKADTSGAFVKYSDSDSLAINPRFYNLFIKLHIENDAGTYDTVPANRNTRGKVLDYYYNTRFFRPAAMDDGEGTEGTIAYPLINAFYSVLASPQIKPERKYYADISIMDRAGNRSNTITTPVITYQP